MIALSYLTNNETKERIMNDWYEEDVKEISVKDITTAIEKLRDADTIAKEKKAAFSVANAEVDDLKRQVIEMLTSSGLKNFKLPGVATVSVVEKLSVQTPKTHEDKEKFFAWLKTKGSDFYLTYASVNSNSLNSMFKLETELAAESGEVLSIPGLGEPTSYTTLSLKK